MKVEWNGTVYELEKRLTAGQLLSRFSLSPEAHLVMADDRLVTEDYGLSQEENVKIIRVISGG